MSSAVSSALPLTLWSTDTALQIFSHLTPTELGLCCQVNSEWRRLASDNWIWRERGRELFGHYLNVPKIKDFLKEYHSQQLRSNDEIVARIQDFTTRVSLGHNGRFRCIIGAGRGHRFISVEIKGDRAELDPMTGTPQDLQDNAREFDIKDTAYASHALGRGDLLNPNPIETREIGGWSKQLGKHDQIWDYTRKPFRVVLRSPLPLKSETDLQTCYHFHNLKHPTQMQQKIAHVLQNKVVALSAQNNRELNKRIAAVGVSAILLLGFTMKL